MAISEEELNIFIQHLVPAGRHNAQAVRFFRRFFTSLIQNIGATTAAATTAGQAVTDAGVAKQCAVDAQGEVDALEAVVQAFQATYAQHIGQAAGSGVLGHVTQGPAVAALGASGIGAAPAAYSTAFDDAQTAEIDATRARLDQLIASLKASGVIA